MYDMSFLYAKGRKDINTTHKFMTTLKYLGYNIIWFYNKWIFENICESHTWVCVFFLCMRYSGFWQIWLCKPTRYGI